MRKTTQALPALFLFLVLTLLPAFTAPAQTRAEITDLAGRQVSVPLNPARIVCLGPGSLRLIVYLKAQSRVVGMETMEKRRGGRPYILAQEQLLNLPMVSPGGPAAINKKPDLEGLLRVRPQVIFITQLQAAKADQVQKLLGIPVVVLSYGQFASFDEMVYDSLRLAGKILKREKRAQEVIDYLEAGRRDLGQRTRAASSAPQAGLYVGGIGFRGSHGIESSDSRYIPFSWLGARNVIKPQGKRGHVFINKEDLLRLQPHTIFLDGGGMGLVESDYGKKKSFYQTLHAFKARRVYSLFPFNWYTTNLGTTLADAYCIGKIVYPQAFADIDPVAKADEIYQYLVGRPVYRAMAGMYGPLGGRPPFLR